MSEIKSILRFLGGIIRIDNFDLQFLYVNPILHTASILYSIFI